MTDAAILWQVADKLRGSIDAAEFKHVVLGLIFLRYLSGAFERIQAQAAHPGISKIIDDAMLAIEENNPKLKGKLSRDYARWDIHPGKLAGLIEVIGSIGAGPAQTSDELGRVYEYFLGKFAAAEGKLGGEFFTPHCVVRLLVEMIEPFQGRVFDPCCGSGGMFVQSKRFADAHGGSRRDISIFGQESNATTWRLAHMNLAIRGIDANLGAGPADSFLHDAHSGLEADYILSNPPFNVSDWSGQTLRDDARWKFGIPPAGNANYAWIQHFIHHLAPGGTAGFVMANGSMSSNQSGEGAIRTAIVESDLVDCIVALPGQLFFSTQIPVCLWLISRSKHNRRGQTLFIDSRQAGNMVDRVHAELTDAEISRIAATYRAWRSSAFSDVPGFARSATIDEIRRHRHALVPGRYVGFADRPQSTWTREELSREVTELESRLRDVSKASAAAMATIAGVLHG